MTIKFVKNSIGRKDIPYLAELYDDNGNRITYVPVRLEWTDYSVCLKCGLKAKNGWNGELNCTCYGDEGALRIEKYSLKEAKEKAKKELKEYAQNMKKSYDYIVTANNGLVPSGFRFGNTDRDNTIATSNNLSELIKKYGKNKKYVIWKMRQGGAMRDYAEQYYVGE